jgi:hypothetical protein
MEVDDVEVSPHRRSDAVTPDRLPSSSAGTQAASDARAIQDDDARVDVVDGKGKEKVEEKKKEPVFIRGVELVDLDDCDVLDMKLHCDSDDMDDDDAPKSEGMDVEDSGASSLQCLEPKLGPVAKPVLRVCNVWSRNWALQRSWCRL